MRYGILAPTTILATVLLAGCADERAVTALDIEEAAVQQCHIFKPVSDISGSEPVQWESLPWWQKLDEGVPDDDASYIFRNRYGPDPVNVTGTVRVAAGSNEPTGVSTGTIRVRWKVTGDYSTQYPPTMLNIRVIHGATPIASVGAWPSPNYTTTSYGVYLGDLTNFKGLRLKLDGYLKPAGFGMIQARVTWVELEVCS
jgi:hypothetical protein